MKIGDIVISINSESVYIYIGEDKKTGLSSVILLGNRIKNFAVKCLRIYMTETNLLRKMKPSEIRRINHLLHFQFLKDKYKGDV